MFSRSLSHEIWFKTNKLEGKKHGLWNGQYLTEPHEYLEEMGQHKMRLKKDICHRVKGLSMPYYLAFYLRH